jgi:hypothetical protein
MVKPAAQSLGVYTIIDSIQELSQHREVERWADPLGVEVFQPFAHQVHEGRQMHALDVLGCWTIGHGVNSNPALVVFWWRRGIRRGTR